MFQIQVPPLPTFFAAGEDTYKNGQTHPNRYKVGVFDLLIVTKGCLYMGEDNNRFRLYAEQALILFPDRHHFSYKPCEEETHFYWFHFNTTKEWRVLTDTQPKGGDESFEDQSNNPFSEQPFSIRLPKMCKIQNWTGVERLCHQILTSANENIFSWEWQRQILFQQLLQELSNNTFIEQSLPSVVVAEKAAAYIRKNYQQKITYQKLGEALLFHPNHIARCMINTLGYTPIGYLNRIRIDQAKLLLVSTDWNIERISESSGFSEQAYFSRIFKKLENLSPNDFRKQFVRRTQKKGVSD